MYLYKKNNDKTITLYSFIPNNVELIEFKKKYLEQIKSVILHISNHNTRDILLKCPTIRFNALDRKEIDGSISYIEETNNNNVISQYVNGDFDYLNPLYVIGDSSSNKSFYSGKLYNENGSLLFTGGYNYKREFITEEGILLTGILGTLQSLLSDDVKNLIYSDFLRYLDEDVIQFLKIFNCKKEGVISLDDLKFLQENNIIHFNDDFQDIFDKSEEVLSTYNKAQARIKKI